jgi:hypothetical protein
MGRTACTEPQCLYKGALYLTFLPIFKNGLTKDIINSKHYADYATDVSMREDGAGLLLVSEYFIRR